ncbi:BCS1 N terminal-domain-containing protein [Chaetomium sp. MPI-SDFR-AT-0129]|nr:BCS1 N terminal-domain-containing protein [Chaetomium sp. MPI-SDFR-AT-0129]
MDFTSFIRGSTPSSTTANATHEANNSAEGSLPRDLLDTLSPLLGFQFNPLMKLFMILYELVGNKLGIDPTYILTAIGLFWAASKLWDQLYTTFYALVRRHFMSSIEVSSSDDIYLHLMKWLAAQPVMVNSRLLFAETASVGAWEEQDDFDAMNPRAITQNPSGFLNFSSEEAKAPPRFTPALGTHNFWFKGRYFGLSRRKESLFDPSGGTHNKPQYKDKEKLVLTCFGRSPEPIKRLLKHAKEHYYLDHDAKTIVRRPSQQSVRRYSHGPMWQTVADRPVRPMQTVVLDDEQKARVLLDMNEYLHPATPRWYANRGIPLRRGYLFYGPPGTGKTSLSFALAGVFGLDIYVISLFDPGLNEEDLLALFTSLPRRCVVLLEDIDAAGLRRSENNEFPSPSSSAETKGQNPGQEQKDKDNDKASAEGTTQKPKKKTDWEVTDLARELRRVSYAAHFDKKGITLSGLLNAIDGVASHEGRVLIMTTNKPETLDEALIRPGRIDLQIGFSAATQAQARELFVRMYESEDAVASPPPKFAEFSLKDHLSSSPVLPVTPFSELPPTPCSLPSDKDGNMTDVSGATEVEADDEDDEDNDSNNKNDKPDDIPKSPASNPSSKSTGSTVTGKKPSPLFLHNNNTRKLNSSTTFSIDNKPMTHAELLHLADQFGSRVPAGQFSPAELQGFLLMRKKTPRRALAEIDAWVQGVLKQRAGGSKVLSLSVQ